MPLRWPFGKSRAVGKAAVADAAVEVAERRDGGDAVAPVSVLNPSAPVIARSTATDLVGETSIAGASGGDNVPALPDVVLAKPEAMPIRFTVAPAIASLPSAVVPVIEILESQMVSVLTDRLKALGEIESGLGAYYAGRVRSQKAFGDDDRMLLEVLASDYLSYDGIVEIGAGYGQLGLALGVRGRQVICVETDRKRFACMEALKAGLEQTYPAIAQNVSLRFGTWPALLKGEDPSGSLLVAVDFVYTGSGDIEAAAIAELKRHGGAIIDASHFVHSRLTPETRDGFYQSLRSRGFVEPKPLAPHKNSRNSAFVFVKAG